MLDRCDNRYTTKTCVLIAGLHPDPTYTRTQPVSRSCPPRLTMWKANVNEIGGAVLAWVQFLSRLFKILLHPPLLNNLLFNYYSSCHWILNTLALVSLVYHELRYGLVVRIPGSHPGGPGSIPGNGKSFCKVQRK